MTTESGEPRRPAAAKSASSNRPLVSRILLFIVLLPAVVAYFLVGLVSNCLYYCFSALARLEALQQEWIEKSKPRRLRDRLHQRGRLLDDTELDARLGAGEGTLIIVDGIGADGWSKASLGWTRGWPRTSCWWTSDDVLQLSPVSLPPAGVSNRQLFDDPQWLELIYRDEYKQYVQQFIARYLDVNHGCAYLTTFPKQGLKVVTVKVLGQETYLLEGGSAF
jgi:hypothetical protein